MGAFGGYFPWDFVRQLEADPGPFQGIGSYCSARVEQPDCLRISVQRSPDSLSDCRVSGLHTM